ncbi:hypothetical protein ACFL1Q_00035 [Patescibacteria group bacterium]
MKKIVLLISILCLLGLVFTGDIQAKKSTCTTIQSGELYGSDSSLLTVGFNEWGYNYQGRTYNGMYCDYHPVYRPGGANHDWCIANYSDVHLSMKWNDAWLSNKDCDGDGLLDRYYGFDSYIGSGAWTTNHMSGGTGKDKWTYFVKIVAVPEDAVLVDGIWYTADGTEIGPEIWGAFAIIQETESGSGLIYGSPLRKGLGNW